MLNSLNPNDWDIIAIQEPHIDFNGVTRATHPWRVVYPTRHYLLARETRSIILINKNLATNHWESLAIDSSDIMAIHLTGEFGEVQIVNVYNDCTHSRNLECLERFLLSLPTTRSNQTNAKYDIWLGDFNRHDPLWENPDNAQLFTAANIEEAEILINLLADFGMDIALEPGIPTLEHSATKNLHRVDHVFCSHSFSPRFSRCEVIPQDRPPKTDHFPIVSVIDLSVKRSKEPPRRNFRDTDWDEFKKGLKTKLSRLELYIPEVTL
jgi:endonuclease/exonuclease/phosphatase family metal-dependent hydrolase